MGMSVADGGGVKKGVGRGDLIDSSLLCPHSKTSRSQDKAGEVRM